MQMTRTNVPQEFGVVQRDSQRVLAILRNVMVELESSVSNVRHREQPEFAPRAQQRYVITYSRHS
jgi:hypothetical protein